MSTMASFSDQIRRAIDDSGLPRSEICREIDTDEAVMSRFMNGQGGLSIRSIDLLMKLLGLTLSTKKAKRKGR